MSQLRIKFRKSFGIFQDAVNRTIELDYSQPKLYKKVRKFYEEQGLLTRENFDYEQAADLSAARWQAMAKFYAEQGMLTRAELDYAQAADHSAARRPAPPPRCRRRPSPRPRSWARASRPSRAGWTQARAAPRGP